MTAGVICHDRPYSRDRVGDTGRLPQHNDVDRCLSTTLSPSSSSCRTIAVLSAQVRQFKHSSSYLLDSLLSLSDIACSLVSA